MNENYDWQSFVQFSDKINELRAAKAALGWGHISAIYVSGQHPLNGPCGIAPSEMQAYHWIAKVQQNSGATYLVVSINSEGKTTLETREPPE